MITGQKLWNRDFVAVCFSSFFLFITFYILAVTLPIFVTDTLHGGQQQIGLLMTVFIISTVIFRPLTGKWMDEWNRKKIVLFSLERLRSSLSLIAAKEKESGISAFS